MILYWGARAKVDLYLNDLPQHWQREHDNFKYIPVLSEPLESDHWNGRTGLVHQAVMYDLSDLSAYQVYACGTPVMVKAAYHDFTTQCNLPKDAFFSDVFTPSTSKA